MTNTICIAKAYGEKPLRRCVTDRNKKVIYLVNPSYIDSGGIQEKFGVGFPPNCVFKYEESLYNNLLEAYETNDSHRLGTLWRQAKTLDVPK